MCCQMAAACCWLVTMEEQQPEHTHCLSLYAPAQKHPEALLLVEALRMLQERPLFLMICAPLLRCMYTHMPDIARLLASAGCCWLMITAEQQPEGVRFLQ